MTAYSIGAKSLTIMMDDGEVHMLDDTDKRFTKIKAMLQENPPKLAEALKLMDLKSVVQETTAGRVHIDATGVQFEGQPLNGYMAERLVDMAGAGMDVRPWMHFMDNLMENPSADTREDIFKWMEVGKMPITEDGCIVGFKKVRENYRDVHSGKFDNSVGSVLSMPREQCDTNRNRTCSTGFHFCSADYLSQFSGERVMVVKIDPRDVTAIPKDYNNTKARCCRYEVTGELSSQAAARHKVFQEPVMPEDPQEIPDLMAKSTKPSDVKPRRPGPASPVGRKGASTKVAANASQASKAKGAAKQTSATPAKSRSRKKPEGTVAKAVKAGTKIVAGLAEAVVDAVAPDTSKAKRTTVKVSKPAASKTKGSGKKAATPATKGAPAQRSDAGRASKAKAPAKTKAPTKDSKVAGKSPRTGKNVLKPATSAKAKTSKSKAKAKVAPDVPSGGVVVAAKPARRRSPKK